LKFNEKTKEKGNILEPGVDVLIVTRYLEFETLSGEVRDLTDEVQEALERVSLKAGVVTVFVPGATGAVTTIEYEDGLVADLADALQRIAPQEIEYAHNERWHDGNGHSHIRASLLGPSISVPFNERKLMLGTWQQIVFLELDNRPRQRKVVLQIMGE
jgi:secondary thiamine-phosphate synthase enzyme